MPEERALFVLTGWQQGSSPDLQRLGKGSRCSS